MRCSKQRDMIEYHDHSISVDLHQDPFRSLEVDLPVEYLILGSEIEPPTGDYDNNLPTHDLMFVVDIPVVLPCAVVKVTRDRFVVGQTLESSPVIMMQSGLVIVDEHADCDVHSVHYTEFLCRIICYG